MKPFTDPSGPTELLPATSTPLDFFNLMFGEDFFKTLAEATNLNAADKRPPPAGAAHGRFATSDPKWHVTSAAEMRSFFAINMVMGINMKPEYKDYWRDNTVLRDSYVTAIMTRLRYEKLTQYFHCLVEGQEDPQDKVRKVRPMITRCEARFRACFQPGKNVSIDEAMVKFDGRLLETVYASEASQVGHEALVSLRCRVRILQCLLRLHRSNSGER